MPNRARSRRDPIAVIESLYQHIEASPEVWLDELRRQTLRLFEEEIGVTAFEVRVASDLGCVVGAIAPDARMSELHRGALAMVGARHDGQPRSMVAAFLDLLPPPVREGVLLRGSVSKLTTALRAAPLAWFEHFRSARGLDDAINAVGIDPSGRGVVLSVATPPRGRGSGVPRALARIAGHLASVHRLRVRRPPDEAIVDRGRVVHAESDARDGDVRGALRDAALAIDRARKASARGDDPAEMWRALVEGRYTLVERFESDGRRLFVARRNDPPHRATAALHDLERKAVALYALGRAQKYISFELGVDEARVSRLLRSAAKKMGARTRTELIALHGRLIAEGPSAER